MPQPIISAQKVTQNIHINQQTLTILKNIDLDIYQGEQIAITGRSGSGKSTQLPRNHSIKNWTFFFSFTRSK